MNYKSHFFVKSLIAWIIFFFFTLGLVSCKTLSAPDPAQDNEKTSQAEPPQQKSIQDKPDALIHDIGLAGSFDPVALDQATLDLIIKHSGKDIFKHEWGHIDATIQVQHAERLNLGTRDYRLREIS